MIKSQNKSSLFITVSYRIVSLNTTARKAAGRVKGVSSKY